MDVTVVSNKGVAVHIAVLGNVTVGYSPQQQDLLAELTDDQIYRKNMLLDLSQAPMIDSSGVGWLLRCHKRFDETGGRMLIHSVAPAVSSVLKVLKLDQVFTLAVDAADAEAIVQGENS